MSNILPNCLKQVICFHTLSTVSSEEPIIIDVGGPPPNQIGYNGLQPQQVPTGPEYGFQNPVDDSMYYYNNANPMFSGPGEGFLWKLLLFLSFYF